MAADGGGWRRHYWGALEVTQMAGGWQSWILHCFVVRGGRRKTGHYPGRSACGRRQLLSRALFGWRFNTKNTKNK